MYEIFCDLDDQRNGKGIDVDELILIEELDKRGQLTEAGGASEISRLIIDTPSALNCEKYAQIVREKAVRRRMISNANQQAQLAFDETLSIDDAVSKGSLGWQNVINHSVSDDAGVTMEEGISRQLNRMKNISNGDTNYLLTGWTEYDNLLGGLAPGNLITIAGQTGTGKTIVLDDLARYVAGECNKKVIKFTMEMSVDENVDRLVAAELEIDSQRLRQAKLEPEESQKYGNALQRISEWPLIIDDTPGLRPDQMRAKVAKYFALLDGVDLILVDYLQLMTAPGHKNRTEEISYISRNMKALAKEVKVPIVQAAQLSRATDYADNKEPELSHLRESGSIEHDSNIVTFVYRPDGVNLPLVKLLTKKHRGGPLGTVTLSNRLAFCKFVNPGQTTKDIDHNLNMVTPQEEKKLL